MKTLTLIRGINKSGKSSLASMLKGYVVDENNSLGKDWMHDHTDKHFSSGDNDIVVVGCFIKLKDMQWYARKAIQHGYSFQVIECKGVFGEQDEETVMQHEVYECYHDITQLLHQKLTPSDKVRIKHTALVRPTSGKVNRIGQPSKVLY